MIKNRIRVTNLKNLMESYVCEPDVVRAVHSNPVRHVEDVTAPVREDGACLRVQGEHCGHGDGALSHVLEVVRGVEAAETGIPPE